jgi:hypothetical protein
MGIAASLLVIAAAVSQPMPAASQSPASHAPHRVVATAAIQAIILRPAVIDFGEAASPPEDKPQPRKIMYRQITRQGERISIAFN